MANVDFVNENEEGGDEEVPISTVWTVGAVDKVVSSADVDMDSGWEQVCKNGKKMKKKKSIEVTLDSGAGAGCWPSDLLKEVPMGPKVKGVRFKVANGTELKYYGTKVVRFVPDDAIKQNGQKMKNDMCEMKFHVTDTTKPLAAAMAVVKLGNRVVLEQGDGKSYIENLETGDRVMLKESGGTFVFDIDCEKAAMTSTFSRRA